MKLLNRKDDKPTGGASRRSHDGDGHLVPHRVTIGLARSEKLAAMLASSRASKTIEIADLVGGMYLYDWDRLSRYWSEDSRDTSESLLRRICLISPQRWNYWMELYDSQKNSVKKQTKAQPRSWRVLQRLALTRKTDVGSQKILRQSTALRGIFEQAEKIAPFRDAIGDRRIPVLTNECVLLCVVRNSRTAGSQLGRRLVETGLDVARLELAALAPKRPPIR